MRSLRVSPYIYSVRISIVLIFIIVNLFTLTSCQIESSRQHMHDICTGMTIDESLSVLQNNDLNPKLTVESIGREDGRYFDLYIFEPTNGSDALYLMYVENQDSSMILDSMYWWINWTTDIQKPKNLRAYNWEYIQYIDIDMIKARLGGSRNGVGYR